MARFSNVQVYVIGCGGIGGYLLNLLPQTMACLMLDTAPKAYCNQMMANEGKREGAQPYNSFTRLALIDGDSFTGHNALRQAGVSGSKLVKAMRMVREQDAFSNWLADTKLKGYQLYLKPENMPKVFGHEEDAVHVVFLCVDNHKTRYQVTRYCEEHLRNCIVINGGNEKFMGNVTFYERKDGVPLDPPIYEIYPEVTEDADQRPDEVACGVVAATNNQTAITNNMIASIMLAMFSQWYRTGNLLQQTRQLDDKGKHVMIRRNEVVVNFASFTMAPLSHKVTEKRDEDSVEGAEGEEIEYC